MMKQTNSGRPGRPGRSETGGAAVLDAAPPQERQRSKRALQDEVERLGAALNQGRLDERAHADAFSGEGRAVLECFNGILDTVISRFRTLSHYVERIANGDIPPKITEHREGEFDTIKNNLNICIDALNELITEMNRMSDEHNKGDIDVRMPADRFRGAYRTMAEGVNGMVAGHIAVKKKAMACVAEFGKGNFDAPLDRFPGKKAFINDTIELLRANLRTFIAEMNRMSD